MNLSLGAVGESIAAAHLESLGYTLLGRNLRVAGGELDIVARLGDSLRFVEVKTVSADADYDPLELIGRAKQRTLIRAARSYMAVHWTGPWPEIAFDAVGIRMTDPPTLRLVQEAFSA